MIQQNSQHRGLLIVANYNQHKEIRAFLEKCLQYFPIQDTLVVDDGSNDDSEKIAEELGFKVLIHPKNKGIGAAIRTGIHYAQKNGYQWVLISSANGKIRPEDFASLSTPIIQGTLDYTQGSRFAPGGQSPGLTPFRRWAIPVFSIFTSLILKRIFTDITCGARAYNLSILKHPSVNIEQEWLDRYEMEYYIHYKAVKTKVRMQEVPVTIVYSHLEKGRKSKIKPFSGWWSMTRPFLYLALGLRN